MAAGLPAWKQEATARLAAHRTRRRNPGAQPALPGMEDSASNSETGRDSVAARVAERYARVPSYREMLAAEAANAARAAEAAARAAQKAHEAAQAMTDVLWADMDQAELDRPEREEPARDQPAWTPEASRADVAEPAPVRIQYHVDPGSLPEPRVNPPQRTMAERARPYSTEIVDPFEDAVIAPAQPLPVRILEFPRELVAARKARPRHAEGPLLESGPAPEKSQLRIFEVESEAISHEAAPAETVEAQALPEWHSIRLDAHPSASASMAAPATARARRSADSPQGNGIASGYQASSRGGEPRGPGNGNADDADQIDSSLLGMLPLHVASIEDRLMAGIVDLALVLIAFLLFVFVFVACTTHPPVGKPALVYAGVALVSFFALYQWIFFTYADGTPGMRYAKIALCTFDDENPSRRAMQWRIAALFLSVMPVGLGFLWALFDDDRLGWHDRISKTYQRSYR